VRYVWVTDGEALEAFETLCVLEGILPALESAHALAWAMEEACKLSADRIILVNLSGRGDKDLEIVNARKEAGR
jgi:tryptophan synthase beta chain